MAKHITDGEREQIIKALRDGKSVTATAKQFRRSPATISKIGRQAGISSGQNEHSLLARATALRRAYGAEARAERIAQGHVVIDLAQQHMFAALMSDDVESRRVMELARTVALMQGAEVGVLRHDERGEGPNDDFHRWLREMTGQEQT